MLLTTCCVADSVSAPRIIEKEQDLTQVKQENSVEITIVENVENKGEHSQKFSCPTMLYSSTSVIWSQRAEIEN